MIRLFANANYDFIKWRRWAYGLTAAIIIPGFALFLMWLNRRPDMVTLSI